MRRPENEWHNQEKLLHCETESVPAQTGLFVDSLLRSNKGNENGGNSVRKGESFTPPFGGFNGEYDKQSACSFGQNAGVLSGEGFSLALPAIF